MCGFFGYLNPRNKKFNYSKFHSSANLISHRGPDDVRYVENGNFYLKFFRLSIVDLSKNGMQPIISKDKRFYLVFNGEIYNAQDLKKRYFNNTIFKSTSDSEVLFHLLLLKKEKAINLLDGMFSFVFYDKLTNKILLARDRFGIKPLYYSFKNNELTFSSEIKPLISFSSNRELNLISSYNFFLRGSMDHYDQTFFNNIVSVKPGNFVIIKNDVLNSKKYWDVTKKNLMIKKGLSPEKKLKNLINSSIDKHLISDRKIGLFLSGGTDSTSLAFLLSQKLDYTLNTFTYGFSDDRNTSEFEDAKQLSKELNINNTSVKINHHYVINNIDKLTKVFESPFTSIRLFGAYKLYEYAKKQNLKVIIEGDGGDEAFGGYDYNYLFYLKDKKAFSKYNFRYIEKIFDFLIKKKNKNSQLLNNLIFQLMTSSHQYGSTSDGTPFVDIDNFNKDLMKNYIDENFFKSIENDGLNHLQFSQLKDIQEIKLPRSLKYKDRMSMNFGIETRVPFLDHKLFKYAFHLNNSQKIKNLETRYIFKKVLKKMSNLNLNYNFTKNTIVDPQGYWLKNNLKDFVNDCFHSRLFDNIGIFDKKVVIKNFDNFCKGNYTTKNSFQFFQILTFFIFYKNFFHEK
jgi:asparagine synthase (glutamine-hydrolysing)